MKIDLERLTRYLEGLEPVESYVVASEGLAVKYKGLDPEAAENLAAWAAYIVGEAKEKFCVGDIDSSLFYLVDRDIVVRVYGERDSIVVLARRGYGQAILNALSGRGPRCGKCGADLSLATIVCPYCGANNPFEATHCARCGRPIISRKCPVCGSTIDPRGVPYSLLDRLSMKKANSVIAEV